MSTTWMHVLRGLDRRALAARFAAGRPVDGRALVGQRLRGVALGLPTLVERLTWSLFAKDVIVDDDGARRGWNARLVQPARRDPDTLATAPLDDARDAMGTPRVFAPFALTSGGDGGACVDYRALAGPLPLTAVVDPLVVLGDLDDDGAPVLLGFSRVVVAGRGLDTPTWFALRPAGPVPDDVRRAGLALLRQRRVTAA